MSQPTARIFETQVRVRYADTDQMGVVYHANYLVWFEIGRVELFRALGFDYNTMERDTGLGVVVVEARVRYKAPARFDDLLSVQTHVSRLRLSVLQFRYEIVRVNDGLLLAEGETTHVVTNRKLEKCGLPPDCEAAMRAAMGDPQ